MAFLTRNLLLFFVMRALNYALRTALRDLHDHRIPSLARLDQQRAIGGASQLLGVSRRTVPRGSAVRREMDTPAPLTLFSKSTIPAVPREVKRRMKERGWQWVGRLWRQIVFAVD